MDSERVNEPTVQSGSAIRWRAASEDAAPEAGPYELLVTWTVADSLAVNYGDLAVWEAQAALRAAADLLSEEEEEEDEEFD